MPRSRRVPADPADPLERRRRRAALLAELAQARELRARVAPRRARLQRTRAALLHRVLRYEPPPPRRDR